MVITNELWGAKNHGSNYMLFDGCTSAFCTLALAKFVAQTIYTAHIKDNKEQILSGDSVSAAPLTAVRTQCTAAAAVSTAHRRPLYQHCCIICIDTALSTPR